MARAVLPVPLGGYAQDTTSHLSFVPQTQLDFTRRDRFSQLLRIKNSFSMREFVKGAPNRGAAFVNKATSDSGTGEPRRLWKFLWSGEARLHDAQLLICKRLQLVARNQQASSRKKRCNNMQWEIII
jgi:hypothetical protein